LNELRAHFLESIVLMPAAVQPMTAFTGTLQRTDIAFCLHGISALKTLP
jgi:hypothetical protein